MKFSTYEKKFTSPMDYRLPRLEWERPKTVTVIRWFHTVSLSPVSLYAGKTVKSLFILKEFFLFSPRPLVTKFNTAL